MARPLAAAVSVLHRHAHALDYEATAVRVAGRSAEAELYERLVVRLRQSADDLDR